MDFPKISFPVESVTTKTCYLNEKLLGDIPSNNLMLPKVIETYGKVEFPILDDYPYLFSSIALSMDGKMAYPDNPEGPLVAKSNRLNQDGALTDFYVLNFLRAYCDIIFQGSNTLHAEKDLVNAIFDEELVEERSKYLNKKTSHPGTIIITLDGTDIPIDHQMFKDKLLPTAIFTTSKGAKYLEEKGNGRFKQVIDLNTNTNLSSAMIFEKEENFIPVITADKDGGTDLNLFMGSLKKAGANHILVESPTITWLLLKEKLLNEFFITYTTTFIGGKLSPGWNMPFTYEDHPHSEIIQLNNHNSSFIFTRQLLNY